MAKTNELGYTFNQVWSHIAKELEKSKQKLRIIHPKSHNYGKLSAIRPKQQTHL
jgi:hypothetical protein